MKVDDLKFGDYIYFDNDTNPFIYIGNGNCQRPWHSVCVSFQDISKSKITKIQRYVPANEALCTIHPSIKDSIFALQIIYERKEILDKKEKEWLGNFIKSTKMKNVKIKKWLGASGKNEYLQILYEIFNWEYKTLRSDSLYLPIFKKNTMYKSMELNREYSLEELGL